jgi:NAD(P)H-quinone oxidoreductase subunit 4
MNPEFPWLTAIIAFPLIAALAIPVIPDTDAKNVRLYALGIGMLEFCLIIYTFATIRLQ